MNSIGALIATMDQDFLLLDKKSQTILMTAVILYVFRVLESTELTEYFKEKLEWKGQDCIDFRKVLQGKGYIQKHLKLFIHADITKQSPDPAAFKIREEDVELARKLKTSKSDLAKKLQASCLRAQRMGYKSRTIEEFDKGMVRVYPALEEFTGKFVNKKFKFLTQSGQQHRDELQQELMAAGIYAQYRAYPEIDDLLHLKNIGMTAIHNRGQNIILEQTSQSRKRLTQNADGTFSGTLMSMDVTDFDMVFSSDAGIGAGGAMITCNALMSSMDGSSCEYERPTDVDRARDLRETVEKLLAKMGTEKARNFASILMGLYDEGFSKFLGMPNDEASDKMNHKEYAEKARQYLDVPKEKAKGFVRRLREELKDFR